MKLFLIFLSMASLALARIGDTPEQCKARYGEAVKVIEDTQSMVFSKAGYMLILSFADGKADYMIVGKGAPADEDFQPLKAEEKVALLSTVRGAGLWQPAIAEAGYQRWANDAEKSAAVYDQEEYSLTIQTGKDAVEGLAAGKANPVAAAPEHVRLVAQTASTSRDTDKKWETSWGSYDKTIYRGRIVKAEVTGSTAGKAIIECHWLGNTVSAASTQTVVKIDKIPVDLKENTKQVFEFGCMFVQDVANYEALGITDEEGSKYYGWVIRVVSESGEVLAAQGARPAMIELITSH